MKSWSEGGPKRVWLSTNLGSGYSSPAIVGEKIFIMGQRSDAQWLLCLNAKDGKELWAARLGDPYTNEFGDGPRGLPTVRDGLVFALGANGEMLCADAATGKEHWRTNLTGFGGKIPGWGYSESPLVDGARVMSTPGGEKGAVVAFDKLTGKVLWQSSLAKQGLHRRGAIHLADDAEERRRAPDHFRQSRARGRSRGGRWTPALAAEIPQRRCILLAARARAQRVGEGGVGLSPFETEREKLFERAGGS